MNLNLSSRKLVPVLTLVVILLGGLLMGQVSDYSIKTQRVCPCDAGDNKVDGEIPCNQVTTVDYIFRTGILDIYNKQEGREIIMCENGEREGVKINQTSDSGYKIASPLLGID